MNEHRWSGWPGAWCLDCGTEDANEICLALCDHDVDEPCPTYKNTPCLEPGSNRCNPYQRGPSHPIPYA